LQESAARKLHRVSPRAFFGDCYVSPSAAR
jgi:hypothetical protein